MMAFAGLNMAANAGGSNAADLFRMEQQQQAAKPQMPQTAADTWICACGAANQGKFCSECGKPRQDGWVCACGAVNKGKFCPECGKRKPEEALQYRCDKCGWEPEDPTKPPRFCPECGDPFGNEDAKA